MIGAALLAAAILPLSTAYSICDFAATEAALDAPFHEARLFNLAIMGIAACIVLVPGIPLVTVLVSTQMLNAVLLLPLLVLMVRLSRDRLVLGDHVVSRTWVVVRRGGRRRAGLRGPAAVVTTVRTFDSPAPAA